MKCNYCKKTINDNSNYCTYCGRPVSIDIFSKKAIDKTIYEAKMLKTDLLIMSEHYCTCGQCSAFQGRIYSISGKSKKYPKLPEIVLKTGSLHQDCRHTFYLFFENDYFEHGDPVKYSNRPFKDYRSKKEIEEYNYNLKLAQEFENDKNNYELLKKELTSICPKSFSGYRRMKKQNTKNFIILKQQAKEIGINL